jgi:AcrR family transcriptional regulator
MNNCSGIFFVPTNRTDRRTNRTRRQLREALTALILEKGYDGVKVEDITNRADLGRTTFYLHYKDKEELLLEAIDTVAEELKEQIGLDGKGSAIQLAPGGPFPGQPGKAAVCFVFRHAAENATLYRMILGGEGAPTALRRLRDIISEAAGDFYSRLNILEGREPGDPTLPRQVVNVCFATSLLGLINWWLEKDQPYPPEEITEYFFRLFLDGARPALGDLSSENKPTT